MKPKMNALSGMAHVATPAAGAKPTSAPAGTNPSRTPPAVISKLKHTPTSPAGAKPPGAQRSGIETAMAAHADLLHPVGKASAGTPARMPVEATNDKLKSGGY